MVSPTTPRCKNPSHLVFYMDLHAWKIKCCCEEVSFVVEKKGCFLAVRYFGKNNPSFQSRGYTHPRTLLLWWKDTGTPCFVKLVLVRKYSDLFRNYWLFVSFTSYFPDVDQKSSLMFGLVDISYILVLNKKDVVSKNKTNKDTTGTNFFFWRHR